MADKPTKKRRRGRKATTAAIIDAAEELFSARGYSAVAVRDIAERAGVSHPIVHTYAGRKADLFRAVLARNQGVMMAAAPGDLDLLATTGLMMREGLTKHRSYLRLLADSALHDLPYEKTPGRFASVDRLVELAEQAASSAPADARSDEDLDPRFVIACVLALFLGWTATESWALPAVGLADMDEAEVIDGLVRVVLGILKENVPNVRRAGAARSQRT